MDENILRLIDEETGFYQKMDAVWAERLTEYREALQAAEEMLQDCSSGLREDVSGTEALEKLEAELPQPVLPPEDLPVEEKFTFLREQLLEFVPRMDRIREESGEAADRERLKTLSGTLELYRDFIQAAMDRLEADRARLEGSRLRLEMLRTYLGV